MKSMKKIRILDSVVTHVILIVVAFIFSFPVYG